MKKLLIATAAMAMVAGTAQAQSSVEIYGVIDTGYGHVSNTTVDKSVSGLINGGLSTSRLGFRGVEDLGGGLKAKFGLEAEFLADTGSQSSTAEALFARESSVGLEGSFGELKLGRVNQFGYALLAKFDAFGGNNVGGAVATGQRQARSENTVQYVTPKMSGFQAGIQTGTRTSSTSLTYGEVAGEFDGNRTNSYFVSYDQGPLELAYVYSDEKDVAGEKYRDFNTAFARYNFGVARVVLGYVQQNIDRKAVATAGAAQSAYTSSTTFSPTDSRETEKLFLGVNVPMGKTTLNAQVEQIEYTLENGTSRKPTVYTLGANYAFSKRTTAYAIYAKANQDNGSAQDLVDAGKWSGFSGSMADKDKTAYTVGIRHTF
jgi:predicted porin